MPNILFHAGEIFVTSRASATPTPRKLLTVQETSFDFKGDLKQLMGEGQFAVDAVVGTTEISMKCKNGQLDPVVYNEIFFGKTAASAGESRVGPEERTITAGAITLLGGADVTQDLGIFNKLTGVQYTRVITAPAAGQYVWGAAGAVTFNASENTQVVLCNYVKNDVAMRSITAQNDPAGTTVTIEAFFAKRARDGGQFNMRFYNVIIPSLNWANKLNEYTLPEFTMQAFAHPTLGVYKTSWTA